MNETNAGVMNLEKVVITTNSELGNILRGS